MKPFIIAEVGSNWHDLQDCLQSIQTAKMCGADAVKFQLFNDLVLYGKMTPYDDNYALPKEWVPKLAEKAKAAGIEFMCTVFSEEMVDFIDPFVVRHKIASAENSWPQFLDKVASKKKPIIMSCGGSGLSEIRNSLNYMTRNGDLDTTLLYCVSAYPSYSHNLFKIDELKGMGHPVGFSDHSLDVIYAPLSAVKHFGAVVLEKHFRLEHITDTPDAKHSLDPLQFRFMVDHILGKEFPYRSSEEYEASSKYNRRLIATKTIVPGQKFEYGNNYGAYRSLVEDHKGLHPLAWGDVEGKSSKHTIEPGEVILWSRE